MSAFELPEQTRVARVRLRVRDLDRQTAFYTRVLGLSAMEAGENLASLSATPGSQALVELVQDAHVDPSRAPTAGLYHLALRHPSRPALGRAARRLFEQGWELEGATDHAFSEALYLRDAEGNGVELYCDRPQAVWPRIGGQLNPRMNTALNVGQLMAEASKPDPKSGEGLLDLGHVHLSVRDLAASERFYADYLGLRVTMRVPGAIFFAAGGYHHHLAVNTWDRSSAPADAATPLVSFTLAVPEAEVLYCLGQRAPLAGHASELLQGSDTPGRLRVRDPDGIWVELELSLAALPAPV